MAGFIEIVIFDKTGDGFADQNPDDENVYRKSFDEPLPHMPRMGEYVAVGGNDLKVDFIVFRAKTLSFQIHLTADKADQSPSWHEAVRAEGFELGPA
jgi:hypothetical protein